MKKSWNKPEVVVLVKSRPEESVLTACKTAAINGPPNNANCVDVTIPGECSTLATS